MAEFSPALIIFLGGFLALAVPNGQLRNIFMLALPAIAGWQLYNLGLGEYGAYEFFGQQLTLTRLDGLSRIFAVIFLIAIALNIIYAWHVRDPLQQFASLVYPASALGGVLAGDLVTLFIFWELAAVGSVMLIIASRNGRAYAAAIRYLIWQIASGVLLLGGIVLYWRATGTLDFDKIISPEMGLDHPAVLMIFLGFGIKSAFPLLHNWVQDAYPESTVTGTIVLSIFTTKMAVYALARGFAGTELLVYIGAIMTAFPIFFAVIENDLRKVLTYSLNNQVGFMVVGVGIGTPLALNGAAAYAFCNILFEGLLFMSMGAVMLRTGTVKGSELGGLYKSMPWTTIFCLIGAASISAFPLFSGFVSKGLIIGAAGKEGFYLVWMTLLFAAAGVFHHSGIKIPYFAFFAHDSGIRCKEAPPHMLIAMGITAALCIIIGISQIFLGPKGDLLYQLLPYEIKIESDHSAYIAYTPAHIITQLQILMYSGLAFIVLQKMGLYPPELKSTNLDTDWLYRIPGRNLLNWAVASVAATWHFVWDNLVRLVQAITRGLYATHGPEGALARSWPVGFMALFTGIMLAIFLVVTFFIV